MGFEKPPRRPPEVEKAMKEGDREKLSAMGRAGNREKQERKLLREEVSDTLAAEQKVLNNEPSTWEQWDKAGGHSPDDYHYPHNDNQPD